MYIISKEGIQDTQSGLTQAKEKQVMFRFSDRPKIFALTPNFCKFFCLIIDIWWESGYFSILKNNRFKKKILPTYPIFFLVVKPVQYLLFLASY